MTATVTSASSSPFTMSNPDGDTRAVLRVVEEPTTTAAACCLQAMRLPLLGARHSRADGR